jgi:hypothetical protein
MILKSITTYQISLNISNSKCPRHVATASGASATGTTTSAVDGAGRFRRTGAFCENT